MSDCYSCLRNKPDMDKLEQENSKLRAIVSLIRRALGETRVETYDEMDTLNLDRATRLLVIESLARSGGNRVIAAELLGVARSTFFLYLKKYNIADFDKSRKRKPREDWVIEGIYPKETAS